MSQNKSVATSHKLNFESGQEPTYLHFISNINSREYSTDSNNLQIDFIALNENSIVLGIKTPKVVAIVHLIKYPEIKAALKNQLDNDFWQGKNNISCFKFDKFNKTTELNSLRVILGFDSGAIRIYRMGTHQEKPKTGNFDIKKNDQLIATLNLVYRDTSNPQLAEIWIKKKVIKLALHPQPSNKGQLMIALFDEGNMVIFNLQNDMVTPPSILDGVDEFLQRQFSFKRLKEQKDKIIKIQQQNFNVLAIYQREFTHIQINLIYPDFTVRSYIKFECTGINEIEILPLNPLKYTNNKSPEMNEFTDPMIIAYTGLDGYFRILELIEARPLFSYRSDYGGFNTFAFNQNYSMVCLGGQDDNTYVINFEKNITCLKLNGHNSFISRAVISSSNDQFTRIISGSYDGNLSFTEVSNDLLKQIRRDQYGGEQTQQDQYFLSDDGMKQNQIQVQNKIQMNTDGICYTYEFQDFVATVNFDGCISIFILQDSKCLEENQNQLQQQQPNQNQQN